MAKNAISKVATKVVNGKSKKREQELEELKKRYEESEKVKAEKTAEIEKINSETKGKIDEFKKNYEELKKRCEEAEKAKIDLQKKLDEAEKAKIDLQKKLEESEQKYKDLVDSMKEDPVDLSNFTSDEKKAYLESMDELALKYEDIAIKKAEANQDAMAKATRRAKFLSTKMS